MEGGAAAARFNHQLVDRRSLRLPVVKFHNNSASAPIDSNLLLVFPDLQRITPRHLGMVSTVHRFVMAIAHTEDETESAVALEGAIDISAAAELKAALLGALGSGKPVRVWLGASTYLDVTAVQLLWAAGQQARTQDVSFAFAGPVPAAVASALADAGFQFLSASVQAG